MDNLNCLLILVFVLSIGIPVYVLLHRSAERKRLREAYEESLQQLRKMPTNSQRHENALAAGRAYANATRNQRGVTLFDETALANDIRAVTANASHSTGSGKSYEQKPQSAKSFKHNSNTKQSLDQRIEALKKLRNADLITDDEFDEKRKELLDSI